MTMENIPSDTETEEQRDDQHSNSTQINDHPPNSTQINDHPPNSTQINDHPPNPTHNDEENITATNTTSKVSPENGISLRQSINRRPVAHMERTRHKRQTLQDMARPLKRWLYRHRSNPYPSKTDKFHLASDSSMTLTQVSNWFANARRRLKNTVRERDVSWERRIVLYNSCVEGNQERLSVNSDDSYQDLVLADHSHNNAHSNDPSHAHSNVPNNASSHVHTNTVGARCERQDSPITVDTSQTHDSLQTLSPQQPTHISTLSPHSSVTIETVAKDNKESPPESLSRLGSESDQVMEEFNDTAPHKYKQSMLQRYLTDSCMSLQMSPPSRLRHQSGSLSSHDYEEMTSSKGSPFTDLQCDERLNNYEEVSRNWTRIESRAEDDIYWKEISAALALTTLSRAGKHQQILSTQHDPLNTI